MEIYLQGLTMGLAYVRDALCMSLSGQMPAELRDVDHRREVEDADHLRAEQPRHAAL